MSKDIIAMADSNGEFLALDDGFMYYFPSRKGGLSSSELRVIADELDERNVEIQKMIDLLEHYE